MENVLDIVIVFTALVAGFLGWRLGVMRVVVPLVGSGAGVLAPLGRGLGWAMYDSSIRPLRLRKNAAISSVMLAESCFPSW